MSVLERLGPRYTVQREIGAGGAGRVFLVRDEHLERDLALKVLREPPGDGADLEHLAEEFALLIKLDHPGIARAYDFGFVDGVPWFTSEFIRGRTLPVPVPGQDGRPFDLAAFLHRARSLLDALAFLHRAGILHLDIKPSNILVAASGEPVLIDFGLFRRGLPSGSRAPARGSLPFLAPEYLERGALGPWTDVYALGATLYQAVTGRLPRPAGSGGMEVGVAPPLPPSRLQPRLPVELDHILLKSLALDPSRRFQSAGEMLDLLGRVDVAPAPAPASRAVALTTIGRSHEIAQVDALLGGLAAGVEGERAAPRVLLVTGPSGMGQSHLLREAKVRAQTGGIPFYLEIAYPGRRPPPGRVLASIGNHLDGDPRRRWTTFLERLARARPPRPDEAETGERRVRWRGEISLALESLDGPLVLAVDRLELFDETSILLLEDLTRVLLEGSGAAAPRLGVIVGCREEGALTHLVHELAGTVLRSERAAAVSLAPLGPRECRDLFLAAGGSESELPGGLTLFQETGGSAAAVVARARRTPTGSDAAERGASEAAAGLDLPAAGTRERSLFLALALLARPATDVELAACCGLSSAAAGRHLERLHGAGLVVAEQPGSPVSAWTVSPACRGLAERCGRRELRCVHRLIAEALAAQREPMAAFEAVRHFESAGRRADFVRYGLRAAAYLRDTFQNRTALDLLRRILGVLPDAHVARRLRVVLALAEMHARIGEIDEGIDLLRRELRRRQRSRATPRPELLLQLATLHSRNGDFQVADRLFRQGLEAVRRGEARLSREERLVFLNEHAAMKVFVGDHQGALALCEEGLALARRGSAGNAVAEIVLNLYATRANVALRGFRFEDAVEDFLIALEKAESLGSVVNQAVILNNLGIAYSQSDRYADAVEVFGRAAETCRALDEGPSLTFIYGNLAVLHAKTGDFPAMDGALEKARALVDPVVPRSESGPRAGRRQRLFFEHHLGLSLLYRGRPAAARPHLEAAIGHGREIGDALAVSFAELYRAECLLLEGALGDAKRELRRLGRGETSGMLRRPVLARLAFLEALAGSGRTVAAVVARYRRVRPPDRPVRFLDAWDELFLAWALSLSGQWERALETVASPESFFLAGGMRPGAALAACVRAETHFLRGDTRVALQVLESASPAGDLTAVIHPLLEARCRLEDGDAAALRRCSDLLAEAGAALVGNVLAEWELRLDVLLRALLGEKAAAAPAARRREELAHALPDANRNRYIRHPAWRRWTRLPRFRRPRRHVAAGEASDRTAPLPGGPGRPIRHGLVVDSPAMRRLADQVDRLRRCEWPVLIEGEIGTGKELVARTIHRESPRGEGPFLVLDCCAIPEPLFELELFGARRGAFTDLVEDRAGLLERAAGGAVLFDEIAAVPPAVQAKLLRVLSTGEFRPLGAEEVRHADVRFLFTTARDVSDEVRTGRFRQDLYHRISAGTVRVPPLRERREDIPLLARLFVEEAGGPPPELEEGFLDALSARDWPGNVLEMRNLIRRLVLEHPRSIPAGAAHLPEEPAGGERGTGFPVPLLARASLEELRERLERDYILFHLRRLHGDTRAVSRLLGIGRKQFYRRCRTLGIRLRDERRARRKHRRGDVIDDR